MTLRQWRSLARKRIQIRDDRGAIDFDFPECKITTDDEGNPVEIQPYERNIATRIIEEFMLLANETVAQEYYWRDVPFVYRTHEKPDPEKIRTLNTFVYNMGHRIKGSKGGDVHPKALQALLEELEGKPEEGILARLTLRSMKQAKYTVNMETGHFGLAARYYCHFTSPIRRYPDLMIHRIIKHTLHHGYEDAWLEKDGQDIGEDGRTVLRHGAKSAGSGARCRPVYESAVYEEPLQERSRKDPVRRRDLRRHSQRDLC
ncbi:MAG: RNB domain-containing ribonuclease [Clostridia bacterium]